MPTMQTGGDLFRYLGHFRQPGVMTEGHNQVPGAGAAAARAPGIPFARVAPTFDATANPKAATRQTNRALVGGAREQLRADRRANRAGGGRFAQAGAPGPGALRADVQALRSDRTQARAAMDAARGARQARNTLGLQRADTAALRQARQTARATTRANKRAAVGQARGALQTARQTLRTARQSNRAGRGRFAAPGAVGPGGVQAARQTTRAARQTLRATRRGR